MRVTATRSGDWWALEAEHDGQPVFTQVRRLEQAEAMVRDAFDTLDVDVADEAIDVVVSLGGSLDAEVAAATSASRRAADLNRKASETMRAAVSKLRRSGLTVRDTAVVLKVSPQRISQLDSTPGLVAAKKVTPGKLRTVRPAAAKKAPGSSVTRSAVTGARTKPAGKSPRA